MNGKIVPQAPGRTSVRKAAAGALQEVAELKQTLETMIASINATFNQSFTQLGHLTEQVDALVALLGTEKVIETISTNRVTKARELAARKREDIANALEAGRIVKLEAVTKDALVVGIEYLADGKVQEPGYVALRFGEIKPAFQEKLLDKAVGFEVPTENGGKFIINEIYGFSPPKAVPAPVEAAPEAPAADAAPAEAPAETSAPEQA